MVVPVEDCSDINKVVECVGNNLKLNFSHNKESLTVVGNNCTIKISENSGSIKIIGNACNTTVHKGTGNIEYVGNNGKIFLGPSVPVENVTYLGNKGIISSVSGVFNCDTSLSEKSTDITVNGGCSYSKIVNIDMSDVKFNFRRKQSLTIKKNVFERH